MQKNNPSRKSDCPSSARNRLLTQTHQEVNFCPSKQKNEAAAQKARAPPVPFPQNQRIKVINSERSVQSQNNLQFNQTSSSANLPTMLNDTYQSMKNGVHMFDNNTNPLGISTFDYIQDELAKIKNELKPVNFRGLIDPYNVEQASKSRKRQRSRRSQGYLQRTKLKKKFSQKSLQGIQNNKVIVRYRIGRQLSQSSIERQKTNINFSTLKEIKAHQKLDTTRIPEDRKNSTTRLKFKKNQQFYSSKVNAISNKAFKRVTELLTRLACKKAPSMAIQNQQKRLSMKAQRAIKMTQIKKKWEQQPHRGDILCLNLNYTALDQTASEVFMGGNGLAVVKYQHAEAQEHSYMTQQHPAGCSLPRQYPSVNQTHQINQTQISKPPAYLMAANCETLRLNSRNDVRSTA